MPGVSCGIRALSRRGTKGRTQRSGRKGASWSLPVVTLPGACTKAGASLLQCRDPGRSQECLSGSCPREGASLVQCRHGAVGSGVFVRAGPWAGPSLLQGRHRDGGSGVCAGRIEQGPDLNRLSAGTEMQLQEYFQAVGTRPGSAQGPRCGLSSVSRLIERGHGPPCLCAGTEMRPLKGFSRSKSGQDALGFRLES